MLVLASLLPALATAQEDRADAEIVVTAQKREQAAPTVPMSIDVASGDSLRERGIASVEDLQKIAPGLTFTQTPAGPPVLTIRGIGFYDARLAAAPASPVSIGSPPTSRRSPARRSISATAATAM